MASEATVFVGFRAPQRLVRELEDLAHAEGTDRSAEYRNVFEAGLREKRMELALARLRAGEATIEKAAHVAGVSVWEMLDALEERGVPLNFDIEGFEAAVKRFAAEKKPQRSG